MSRKSDFERELASSRRSLVRHRLPMIEVSYAEQAVMTLPECPEQQVIAIKDLDAPKELETYPRLKRLYEEPESSGTK